MATVQFPQGKGASILHLQPVITATLAPLPPRDRAAAAAGTKQLPKVALEELLAQPWPKDGCRDAPQSKRGSDAKER